MSSIFVAGCGGAGPEADGAGGTHADGGGGQGGDHSLPKGGLDERPASGDCALVDPPPQLLSEHPCFDAGEPGAALTEYSVIAPLWSDYAQKARYVAVPDGESIAFDAQGRADLPPGAILVKEFALADRKLETRLLGKNADGEFRAFTYVWDETGEDAELTTGGAEIVTDTETWTVPTAEECSSCHTDIAGVVLGFQPNQLAKALTYEATGRTADQLLTLHEVGLIDEPPEAVPLIDYADLESPLEDRARSYLHANCAHCHQPGGPGGGLMDLRFRGGLTNMNVCDQPPEMGDPTVGQMGSLLAPGAPADSILWVRMTSTDPAWRMPPLASKIPDDLGSGVVEDWISSLDECP